MTSCYPHAELFTSVTVCKHVCEFQDVGEALTPSSETGSLDPSRLVLCHCWVRQNKSILSVLMCASG